MGDWSSADREQLLRHGIVPEEAERQLQLFRDPPPPTVLDRPCTPGDGVRVLGEAEQAEALRRHHAAMEGGRFLKMVPASGAATRMFKALQWARQELPAVRRSDLERCADDERARVTLAFIERIDRFAFFENLRETARTAGYDPDEVLGGEDFRTALDLLLDEQGLGMADRPKGLIPFHRYDGESRTPVEEHLLEAADYTRDEHGRCRLHFTVSEEHRTGFVEHIDHVRSGWEERLGVHFDVGLSVQEPSTDTLAVDPENQPFRTSDGRILLRPGGHGALIGNLNDLKGNLVYLKNIDNVVPERLRDETARWKRILGGVLAEVQAEVFAVVEELRERTPEAIRAAEELLRDRLDGDLPPEYANTGEGERYDALLALLDRPVRVCGVVRNEGEPGGGPFWVRRPDGRVTRQIVEGAEIDEGSEEQVRIFRSATHFNPVDLVCGVRDSRGEPFDLHRFVDPAAVFISRKSHDGRELKALERPGLWNGAMAGWITIFVEVPLATFNPVKTVIDLLRPQHQAVPSND